jgi:hypothetical protein
MALAIGRRSQLLSEESLVVPLYLDRDRRSHRRELDDIGSRHSVLSWIAPTWRERRSLFAKLSHRGRTKENIVKILLTADIPEVLEFEWLKHVREFDVDHPGCLFQIVGDTAQSTDTIIQLMHAVGFGLIKKLS